MHDLLLNKIAVVTGCKKGIGKSILTKFAENKAEVFACARTQDEEFENYCLEISKKYKTKIHTVFNVNFFSNFLFSQYVVKLMIKNKLQSSIINISSSAAIEANIGRSAYAASKSALITLSKVMSKELSSFNIRVNAIAPGLTNTDMMINSTDDKYLKENFTKLKY